MAVGASDPIAVRAKPAVAYRRILVPAGGDTPCDQAIDVACKLATDRHALVTVVTAIEVPPGLPLEAHMPEGQARCDRALAEARLVAERYGVSVATRSVRARSAGEAIVAEAERAAAEIVVIGAMPSGRRNARAPVFGRTVRFVLAHAPRRVMVAVTGAR
jgi:APA family basic amino acid/polyamine antiporter